MKYLRLMGWVFLGTIALDLITTVINIRYEAGLPHLGWLLGVPFGVFIWKEQEIKGWIARELKEYRAKYAHIEVKPGQILFLRRSDGAMLTEWTTAFARITKFGEASNFELCV